MVIVVNLDVMMARRKITLTQLSEKVDISVVNLGVLKTQRARAIRFTTLAALCKALQCQPGDILEAMEEEDYRRLFPEQEPGPTEE